jgi:actin-related protein 2
MAEPVIILDNGSGYLKAGLSNKEDPNHVSFTEKPILIMPSLIGRTFTGYSEIIGNINLKPIMIGDEVSPVRSLLDLTYPIQEGIEKCTDDMYILWDYCIKKLGIKGDLKDRKILLTEAPLNPNENKKKMGELVFEKLGFGYFNIEPQPKLALYCEGMKTGIVLDSGDNFTNCVPIANSYILHHQTKTLDIAGSHITDYLIRLLQLKGYELNQIVDFEFARQFKEKYCFVSCDINSDRKFDKETTYYNSIHKLPDGRKIKISGEKFEAPEILFNPYLYQNESPGIHEMLYNIINVSIYFI